MTTEPKIPGAVIPRRVFTQPGSRQVIPAMSARCPVCPKADTAGPNYEYTSLAACGPHLALESYCTVPCSIPAHLPQSSGAAMGMRSYHWPHCWHRGTHELLCK